jgi:hypothetical protein
VGRILDQADDREGMRDEGDVAGVDLDGMGADVLCHRALEGGIDGLVLPADQVPVAITVTARIAEVPASPPPSRSS